MVGETGEELLVSETTYRLLLGAKIWKGIALLPFRPVMREIDGELCRSSGLALHGSLRVTRGHGIHVCMYVSSWGDFGSACLRVKTSIPEDIGSLHSNLKASISMGMKKKARKRRRRKKEKKKKKKKGTLRSP